MAGVLSCVGLDVQKQLRTSNFASKQMFKVLLQNVEMLRQNTHFKNTPRCTGSCVMGTTSAESRVHQKNNCPTELPSARMV